MGDVGHGSGAEGCAVHDGRVHLVCAVGGKDRSAGGVEERIVFKDADGGFDGVERGAAAIENRSACLHDFGERGAIGRIACQRPAWRVRCRLRRRGRRWPSDEPESVVRTLPQRS